MGNLLPDESVAIAAVDEATEDVVDDADDVGRGKWLIFPATMW